MLSPDMVARLMAHAWVVALSLVVASCVRAMKPDVPIPVNVPPKRRALVAIALGLFGGVAVMAFGLVEGLTWLRAVVGGLVAGGLAIVGHDVLIEGVRGGREFGEPKPPKG